MKLNKKIITFIVFAFILIFAAFVRLYKLGQVPAGVYLDEASLGYNAYSLLLTGKDEFGKAIPLLFRSFSTFQSSLYGYFSIIPAYILGLNIFSTRILSVFSGLILVAVTFLIFYFSDLKNRKSLAIIAAVVVAFSPWAIYQSRVAVEANLGLGLTSIGVLLLYLSLKRNKLIIPSLLVFGISSYAYTGQRITSILIPLIFIFINRKLFIKSKKIVALAFTLLILLMVPQFLSLTHSGSLVRYQTQGYTAKSTFLKNGDSLTKLPLAVGWPLYVARQFSSQYVSVFSPRSLFFEPEPQLVRSIPNLSVFYIWMIIPFFVGISVLWKKRTNSLVKTVILLMLVGVLPEAITGDPFYTLRMLPGLWGVTLMIVFGIEYLLGIVKNTKIKTAIVVSLIIISGLKFYISYFILLAHERSVYFGYPFEVLAGMTEENKNKVFVLDSETFDAPYIWMAFYKKTNPADLQKQTKPDLLAHYYDDLTLNKYKNVGNVEVRKINWGIDDCKDEYIVGDALAISEKQAADHKFTLVREIKDKDNKTILWVYHTNPKLKCTITNKQ